MSAHKPHIYRDDGVWRMYSGHLLLWGNAQGIAWARAAQRWADERNRPCG